MEDFLIPIVMFITLGVTVTLGLMFRLHGKREVQLTFRTAIDKGQELTPDLLKHLSDAVEPERRDMRRGTVAIALGAAFVAFALVLGERDAVRPLLGLSAFPFLVGAAYLILWRTGGRDS